MSSKESVFTRLYVGNGAFDIVGKRKRWYVIFGGIVLICLLSITFRWFNLGIDFEGGTKISMPAASASGPISTERVESVFREAAGKDPSAVQQVGTGGSASIQIKSEALSVAEVSKIKNALFEQLKPQGSGGESSVAQISDSAVSGSWGGEISRQALIALAVFLVLVTIFLALYFERLMAIAAMLSLLHDIVVTAGIYSIIGFEVTPATVIGLLTILGFSLYDTVVVFDKVKENTRGLLGLTRRSYAEAANLALNQTLLRSINTALIALLPVIGLLVVGVGVLGVGTLQDLALVQATGMLAAVLSSIYLATPLLVDLKMRDAKYKQQAERVAQRKANQARKAELGSSLDAAEKAESELDLDDDEAVNAEVRREKAMAIAAGVPSRTPKASDAKRKPGGRPSGKRKR
ncbi:Protein-export membrane protein SecF (TC 3.A.5.1.1) [Alloactinosynnema sp. L-07]|uniref:protein translocase subunit SecF n=1 Tax=Alloactinosynnema sp. L-07 TaxID=1653480 RepID=UPI00065EFDF8|nr:protein translocase subunit SecF [Alloactinosynnema sp. L-07]CRK58115.1 Protein-export membrane protein SecF (TC 3.A.5.1.1) [Alloactinosynnema sp. L-07]